MEPAGDGVADLLSLRRLEEGDMEARALEATVVLEATEGVSGIIAAEADGGHLLNLDVLENIPCGAVHWNVVNQSIRHKKKIASK